MSSNSSTLNRRRRSHKWYERISPRPSQEDKNSLSRHPPPPPLPPSLPGLTLTRVTRGAKEEMNTDAETLAARINTAIKAAIPEGNPRIRAFKRTHRKGDITLLFETQDHIEKVVEVADIWLEKLNRQPKIKNKLYTIMVHGMPTTFDITNERQVTNFATENGRTLDSMESIRWANTNSIALKKPFSSVFITPRVGPDVDPTSGPFAGHFSGEKSLKSATPLAVTHLNRVASSQCHHATLAHGQYHSVSEPARDRTWRTPAPTCCPLDVTAKADCPTFPRERHVTPSYNLC